MYWTLGVWKWLRHSPYNWGPNNAVKYNDLEVRDFKTVIPSVNIERGMWIKDTVFNTPIFFYEFLIDDTRVYFSIILFTFHPSIIVLVGGVNWGICKNFITFPLWTDVSNLMFYFKIASIF